MNPETPPQGRTGPDGDPHYYPFDQGSAVADYQGKCEYSALIISNNLDSCVSTRNFLTRCYILTQKCVDESNKFGANNLAWFRISTKNDAVPQFDDTVFRGQATWQSFARLQFQLNNDSPFVEIVKGVQKR